MSREMKHSGIEWIGDIPKEWKTCYTSSLFHEHKEKNIGLKNTNLLSLSYGKIKQKDINTNEGLLPQSFETYNVIRKGDIVFRLTDLQNDKRSLRTGLCKEDGIITSAYVTLRANAEVDSAYFHFLFHSYDECKVFYGLGDGVRQGMNWADVRKLSVILPPLLEQQKIAEYLDKVCGEVDELVALQEKMIEELKAYKQSVITEAVTKGLNPNVPMKYSGIDWIGEIPEHWRIVPIKHIKSKEPNAFVDGPFGSNLKSEHFIENGDVLVVESGFITTGKFIFKEFKTISTEHFETIKRSQCKAKDIIIAKIGANYGMAGELPDLGKPSVVSGNSLKITLDNSKMLNIIFVNAMICAKNNSGFKGMVQENAQPALSLSGLNNFKLPVPPLSEQQQIASYLDTKCSEIDSLIAIKQQKIEELKEYKKSVIYEYVTGKKEVA